MIIDEALRKAQKKAREANTAFWKKGNDCPLCLRIRAAAKKVVGK